jgi:hypothetical protein
MMKKFIHNILILTLGLCFLYSCSDVNDGPGENPSVSIKDLEGADCDFDIEELAKILEDDVGPQITCLYNKLSAVVKASSDSFLYEGSPAVTRETIEKFLGTFNEKERKDIEKYFGLFFRLNHFIFGTDINVLIERDFERLYKFLLFFNKQMVDLTPYLKSYESAVLIKVHNSIREGIIKKVAKNILDEFTTLLKSRKGLNRNINIVWLIKEFETDSNKDGIANLLNFIFVKKVFLGGSPEELTNRELLTFFETNFLDVVGTIYDVYRHSKLLFDLESKRYSLYEKNLEKVKVYLNRDNPEESRLQFSELFKILNEYKENIWGKGSEIDFSKYAWEFRRVKEIIFGNNDSFFNLKDLDNFLDQAIALSAEGVGFSKIYEENKKYLEDELGKVKKANITNPLGSVRLGKIHFDKFIGILENYRYFLGSGEISMYGDNFERNIDGIVLNGLLEFYIDKIARFYEKQYPCHQDVAYSIFDSSEGIYKPVRRFPDYLCNNKQKDRVEDFQATLHIGQLYLIITELKNFLYETKIVVETREDKSAETATTVPDLFSYVSNDNGLIEVQELVGFFISLFNGSKVNSDVFKYISEKCSGQEADDGITEFGERFDTLCVRENFIPALKKLYKDDKNSSYSYMNYFTKFRDFEFNSRVSGDDAGMVRYTLLIERYSRSCAPYQNIPSSKSDVLGMITALITVEEVIAKYDVNRNNIIDSDEAKKVYKGFERGLKAFIPDFFNFTGKTVFKYLLKYKSLPSSVGDYAKLVGLTFAKMPSADRETMASILVSLKSEGDKKRVSRLGNKYESNEDYCKRVNEVDDLDSSQYDEYFN